MPETDVTSVEQEAEPTQVPESEKATVVSRDGKVFTQEEVNKFVAQERYRLQKQSEKTIKDLEALRRTAQLTEAEKAQLEERIENLKNEFLTKEELAKKEARKEAEKTRKEVEATKKEVDRWRDLYSSSTIERSLTDAAMEGDAFRAPQIVAILRPNTRLVEELDEAGQPTGRLLPKVKFPGKDKDNVDIMLDLNPTDAVKQMKELPDIYGNLFRSGVSGGIGGSNNAAAKVSTGPPVNDPVAFRKWLKEHPEYAGKMPGHRGS